MADAAQGVELAIDVPALLAPIPGDKPTGVNPRDDDSASSTYYDARNVRGVANAAEKDWLNLVLSNAPGADDARDRSVHAWQELREKCETILREKCKDLEILEWVIDALGRLEAIAGLHAGLFLVAEMLEKLWDDIHYSGDPDNPPAQGLHFRPAEQDAGSPPSWRCLCPPPAGVIGSRWPFR